MATEKTKQRVTGLRKIKGNRFTVYYNDDFIETINDFNTAINHGEQSPIFTRAVIIGKNRFGPAIKELMRGYVKLFWKRNKEEEAKEKQDEE
ncbi:hypothetical protein HOE04_05320 [archaeon]|jgi:hypothetical protein|nr:hypothetical protein [archaeon]